MGGMLIPVIEMSRYDFATLAQGSATEVPLRQNIDVTGYPSGSLLVRVHDVHVEASTTAAVNVKVYSVLPSAQDPSKLFRSATPIATITIDEDTDADSLLSATLTAPIGAFVTVSLEANQGVSPAAPFDVTISAELSMKSGS